MAVTHLPEPHSSDPIVEQLTLIFREAHDATVVRLKKLAAKGNSTWFYEQELAELARRVAYLKAMTRAWAYGPVDPVTGTHLIRQSALYRAIAKADRETMQQLAAIGLSVEVPAAGTITPSFALLNDGAIRVVAENLVLSLDRAIDKFDEGARGIIGRLQNDVFRRTGLESVGQKLSQGLTVRQGRAQLVNELTARGIGGFTDSKGRTWNLKAYADMHIRTVTREATSEATMRRLDAFDHDLVRLTAHRPTCPICAGVQGKVFSRSGRTEGYPRMTFKVPLHPNCAHSAVPYTPEYDPAAEATRAFSNTPIDVDPRDKDGVEGYERAMKIKLEQRRKRYLSAQLQAPGLDEAEQERLKRLRKASNGRLIDLNKAQRKQYKGWR